MAYECRLIECYPGFGPTVVTDGNMENDPTTNWPGTGANVVVETANVHAGCQALDVTATAAPGSARQSLTVEAGHRYRIGVWGLCNAATDQWRVTFYIAGSVVWTSAWHNNNVSWEEEVKFYRIPNLITTLEVRLEVDQIGDQVYFDDVTATREFPVPMTEIDLQYSAQGTAGISLLNQGIKPGRPERVSLYGGRLKLELVRQDDGKRSIPLRLIVEGSDGEDLIDRVNALEAMLRQAAIYRTEKMGGEVFLAFKIDDATYSVWFPVCEGLIDTNLVYDKCGGEQVDMIKYLPVSVTCQPLWESDFTYDLFNILDNPGFEEWNGGICDSEPDCWADYESIAAGTGTNQQETDTVEEGCEALRIEVAGINNADYKGVSQDIAARIPRDDIEYTLLVWVQNILITNGNVNVYAEGSVSGVLGTAVNAAAANATYTVYSCQFTPTGGDAAGNVWIRARILATAGGCGGIVHVDKMLVMESSNVPVGWMSSSYLTNHYDRDANEINFFSVCDIPGESEAEMQLDMTMGQQFYLHHIAKRTRDEPCQFIWQLIPCEGYTTAEGGGGGACAPGLTDASCIDSDKIIDAASPSGSHIAVSFAGLQTMQLRAYWDIAADLASYYGRFMLGVICRATGLTDVINMEIRANLGFGTIIWNQGRIISQRVDTAAANQWEVMTGWSLLSWPIGTHNDDLWASGNQWRIELWAETDGIPTDTLQIAGVYLIPLDEGYILAGDSTVPFAANAVATVKNLDGDRGDFVYNAANDRYYPNLGVVGTWPLLTPEVENWLYCAWTTFGGSATEIDITDTMTVSLRYRPRGIFLRGSNP